MADLLKTKSILYNKCVQYVSDRIETAQNLLNVSQDAAKLEVKSSVGDKHETGRAMMHLETEKASMQLAEALKLKKAIANFDDKSVFTRVQLGSLVITSKRNYYVSIGAGKFKIDQKEYYAISPGSPLGSKLGNLTVGEEAVFNDQNFKILDLV